jgi:hypothetical protein
MKIYWFTIAEGKKYLDFFHDLRESAERVGIEIRNMVGGGLSQPASGAAHEQDWLKRQKIEGLLHAPSGYDKVVYLDADTLIQSLEGIELQNGALKEPWGMGNVPLVCSDGGFLRRHVRKKRLMRMLGQSGLSEFCRGGKYYRQEWNSGVIIGERKFVHDLALEWRKWWDIVTDINDGIFCRDQMSFKYAYKKIAMDQYGFESIPLEYNWIVKRLGKNRQAKILHRAGIQAHRHVRLWQEAKAELLRP